MLVLLSGPGPHTSFKCEPNPPRELGNQKQRPCTAFKNENAAKSDWAAMTRAGDTPARAGSSWHRNRLASLRGCFNQFICFSLRHPDHIVQTYATYYYTAQLRQSVGTAPLARGSWPPPNTPTTGEVRSVRRHAYLGGLLNHYERKAA